MTDLRTLRIIQSYDPDGWEHKEPSLADYDAFRTWVLTTYGKEAWQEYCKDWMPDVL